MTSEPKRNHLGLIPLDESPDFIPIGPNGEVEWERVYKFVPKQHMIDVLVDWAEERIREREAQAQEEVTDEQAS